MRKGFNFQVKSRDGHARRSQLTTPHCAVDLPTFMPVGTAASVKSLTPAEVEESGAQIVLGNTYHLMLRPTAPIIERAGGLHRFMGWPHAMLTDSGGYQVFSLSGRRKMDDDGVTFQSHIDGSKHRLTPEIAIEIQGQIGADIAMVLDECPPGDAPRDDVARAVERTTAWARRCVAAHSRKDQALFAIVQGGVFEDLRLAHVEELASERDGFDGFAIGGLSVGEKEEDMWEMTRLVAPKLPEERPRYLMGVGREIDILTAVSAGVDMFDCVLPTRNARNGQAFTSQGRISIKQARYKEDSRPLDESCPCYACKTFDRRYLRHLYICNEILAHRMISLHNIYHFGRLMAGTRQAIEQGCFEAFAQETIARVHRRVE